MKADTDPMCTRKVIYAAMIVLFCAIAVAARGDAVCLCRFHLAAKFIFRCPFVQHV